MRQLESPGSRIPVVGLIWYLWHLSFIGNEIDLFEQVKFLAILVGTSYLFGSLVEKTNSVLLTASLTSASTSWPSAK
jgi:hypothetical protein